MIPEERLLLVVHLLGQLSEPGDPTLAAGGRTSRGCGGGLEGDPDRPVTDAQVARVLDVAEHVADHNGQAELLEGHALDRLGQVFAKTDGAAGYVPQALAGAALTAAQEDTAAIGPGDNHLHREPGHLCVDGLELSLRQRAVCHSDSVGRPGAGRRGAAGRTKRTATIWQMHSKQAEGTDAGNQLIELVSPQGGMVATIDGATGSLVGLRHGHAGWAVLGQARGARPFDLLIPQPGRRLSRTRDVPQARPLVSSMSSGISVELTWGTVATGQDAVHDISVVASYVLDDDALVCSMTIDNRSDLVVETAVFPYLADVLPPDRGASFGAFTHAYGTARRRRLWPHFDNVVGYYGADRPTLVQEPHAMTVPVNPFVLLEGAGQGLYVGVDQPRPELLTFVFELEPGYGESIDSRVPVVPRLAGKDVRLELSSVHIPYVMPGERRALATLRVQFYEGDWQQGASIYRARRRSWMGSSEPPAWAREPHAWQQVQMNSPEGERRYRFSDLPAIARECADADVRAVQLVGWNDGGQDQNNPCHDPDPALGGAAELRQAIAQCQAIGIKIVLFTKFVWADRATDRFRTDLVRLAVKDPYGDYYMHPGYRYQSFTQWLDINTKRLVPMCFASPEWVDVCRQEFQKVLDTGADGMLYDECFHHVPALACFDTGHGHRYGTPVYAHDVDFVRWLRAQSEAPRPDFLYAGEACTDWQLAEYHLSYHRSEDVAHIPLMRYLRPDALIMTAVTGFDDRNMINQCLLYRYIVSYEPYNFKGRLADAPLTVAYGRKMSALRTELRDWLWDGEFQGGLGATVTDRGSGRPHEPYSVFKSLSDASLAIVVANYSVEGEVVLDIVADGMSGLAYRLVDAPQWLPAGDGVRLPPRSAAVVLGKRPS